MSISSGNRNKKRREVFIDRIVGELKRSIDLGVDISELNLDGFEGEERKKIIDFLIRYKKIKDGKGGLPL